MSKTLAAILIAYFAISVIYVSFIPAWEAPDEPAHFLYVNTVLTNGALPAPTPPQRDNFWKHGYVVSNYEWHQQPLYYWLAATALRIGQIGGLPTTFAGFPAVNPDFPGATRVFDADGAPPASLYLTRGVSTLFGLLTVYSVFWLTRRLVADQFFAPELAAGLVAFIPQFTFLSAYVTNDSLTILIGSAGLAALVAVATGSPAQKRRSWLAAGLIAGVGLATKMTAWFLLPLGLGLLCAEWLLDRRGWQENSANLFSFLGSAALLPVLVWLRWPETPARLLDAPQARWINPAAMSLDYFVGLFPLTRSSFWGRFGWMNVPIPEWIVFVFEGIWLIGLIGFVLFLLRRHASLSPAVRRALYLLLAAFGIGVIFFLGFNLTVRQPQGRFLYPTLAGVAAVVAWGWVSLTPRWRRSLVVLLLTAMALLNVVALWSVQTQSY